MVFVTLARALVPCPICRGETAFPGGQGEWQEAKIAAPPERLAP